MIWARGFRRFCPLCTRAKELVPQLAKGTERVWGGCSSILSFSSLSSFTVSSPWPIEWYHPHFRMGFSLSQSSREVNFDEVKGARGSGWDTAHEWSQAALNKSLNKVTEERAW